jgi:hypothetical protein
MFAMLDKLPEAPKVPVPPSVVWRNDTIPLNGSAAAAVFVDSALE